MVANVQPQWIARMYSGKPGRDHLGLGSVSSDQILPSLSPSINVLTFHPRYHSFYAFLLDEFWKRDLPRSWNSFKEFFRPRDFLFSLGANLCERPEHGLLGKIVGAQKTEGWARENKEYYSYEDNYIKSDLGGYGLYYRTVMAELGIIFPSGPGVPIPFDVPTDDVGKDLAHAFRQAIQDTHYYREYFDGPHQDVPLEVIQEYIHHACLCQLKTESAPDRSYLIDTFLRRGAAEQARSRRATFRFFLDIAQQTKGFGLDEEMFRILLYFGETNLEHHYSPSEAVKETYMRWRLYQAREYYAFALNSLWRELCLWEVDNGGMYRPLTLQSFWEHIETNGLDFGMLAKDLGLPAPNLHAHSRFLDMLDWLKDIVGADDKDFDEKCDIRSPIHEHLLYELAQKNDEMPRAATVAGMVALLEFVFGMFENVLAISGHMLLIRPVRFLET